MNSLLIIILCVSVTLVSSGNCGCQSIKIGIACDQSQVYMLPNLCNSRADCYNPCNIWSHKVIATVWCYNCYGLPYNETDFASNINDNEFIFQTQTQT